MKRKMYKFRAMLINTFAYLLISTSISAQSPHKMSYQAVIRNTSDVLVTNTIVGMQISILQGTTVVYIETQTPTTNANGLVSIEIGGGTGFDTISWVYGPYFIKTETDPNGGTSYSITGTSELLSVPYALHAKTAESISGGITETDPVFVTSPANGILSTNITNWNAAFGWGNHANAGYLTTFTELDPVYTAWNKSTGINITASQVSDFQTSVTNNAAVVLNTAKNSYPTADATKLAAIAAGAEVNVNADWNAATGDAQILNKPTLFDGNYNSLSNLPTLNIANWNTAFGWGGHAGLYRPINYVPVWTEITSNPFSFTTSVNNQLIKYNSVSGKWENWTPNYLTTYIETDPIFGAWNKSTGISITASQVSDFQTSVTNNAAVLLNTAKNSYPTADATKLAGIAAGAEVNVNADWNAVSGDAQILNKPTILAGTVSGQMQYWNGTEWVIVAAGLGGQILEYKNGVPTWVDKNINNLYIGETYQGGIIAYFLVSGDPGYDANVRHGLIAAPSDQSTSIFWHATNDGVTGATGTAIGTGNANTNAIIALYGTENNAARICYDLLLGGYNDWYLPSRNELNKLYLNKDAIGGFTNNNYWDSSEFDSANAFIFNFQYGYANIINKTSTYSVRAVRAF